MKGDTDISSSEDTTSVTSSRLSEGDTEPNKFSEGDTEPNKFSEGDTEPVEVIKTYDICDTFGESAVCEYKESLGEPHARECYWEYKEEKVEVPIEEDDEDALTMSAMILNDTMPLIRKIKQLCRYKIFVLKILQFLVSAVLMVVPMFLSRRSTPPRTISWHDVPTILYCFGAAPTLVLSSIFILLYVADQIHDYAEQLYVLTQLIINFFAIFMACFKQPRLAVNGFYAILHYHLTLVLLIDMWFLVVERGWTLFCPRKRVAEIPCVPYQEEAEEGMKENENICVKHFGPPVCEDNPWEDTSPLPKESWESDFD